MQRLLYTIIDPMCSWCWAFSASFTALQQQLADEVRIQYVMGGLAPDSDEPMSVQTREYVQGQWRQIERRCQLRFNWDFWTDCQPRRSTWPACRAVIAAGLQDQAALPLMIDAIQQAYYRQARNPSDEDTLQALAAAIGLDLPRFTADLNSAQVETLLERDFYLRQALGIQQFPSLVLEQAGERRLLCSGYLSAEELLAAWREATPP